MSKITQFVVKAAGGNPTAFRVLDVAKDREYYERDGATMMDEYPEHGVEQSGFWVPSDMHMEMAGGEFCGNATRAAAALHHHLTGESDFTQTVSGYDGPVQSQVTPLDDDTSRVLVTVRFDNLTAEAKPVDVVTPELPEGSQIVDLGGIVHVIVHGKFPERHHEHHRAIRDALQLNDRGAVGVLWLSPVEDGDESSIHMEPVVWVRAIDTLFHEGSCGSGSIAATAATGKSIVRQPSMQNIIVRMQEDGSLTLASPMEVHDLRA